MFSRRINNIAFVILASSQIGHIAYTCNQLKIIFTLVKSQTETIVGKKRVTWKLILNVLLIMWDLILLIVYLVVFIY